VTRIFHTLIGEDYSLLPSSRRQSEESFFFEYRAYGGSMLFRNISSILPISTTSYIRRTQSSEGDVQTFDHLHTNPAGNEFHSEALPQNCKKQLFSFVVYVRLSVRVKQLEFHWTNFCEILYLSIFWKSLEKIQVSWKSPKRNRQFTWKPMHIYGRISLNSSKLRGLSPRADYTDRAAAAGRRS